MGKETPLDRAVEKIGNLQPDVIIIDSDDPQVDLGMLVSTMMRQGVNVKVIGLNLNDNCLWIYRGEQRIAREVKDLLEAIQI